MEWKNLFKDGSLLPIKGLVDKIVYNGLNAPYNEKTELLVTGLSALIALFLLYKLVWIVWKTLKFLLSCIQW